MENGTKFVRQSPIEFFKKFINWLKIRGRDLHTSTCIKYTIPEKVATLRQTKHNKSIIIIIYESNNIQRVTEREK